MQMLLWKRLMGTRVLSSNSAGNAAGNFAAHVWCANSSAPGYASGGVTLAFTNGIKCAPGFPLRQSSPRGPLCAFPGLAWHVRLGARWRRQVLTVSLPRPWEPAPD